MDAASAASTFDFLKTSSICWGSPQPPDAITGIWTESTIAFVRVISNPSLVPSLSILVSKISPAPDFSTFFAHLIASRPVAFFHPQCCNFFWHQSQLQYIVYQIVPLIL